MDDRKKRLLLLLLVVRHLRKRRKASIEKQACLESSETGHQFVQRILNGHDRLCHDLFRMKKDAFLRLASFLRSRRLLSDTYNVTVEEQLAIFLYTVGHNERNRVVQDRFQHSGETISRYFNKVLVAISKIASDIIRPHRSLDEVPPEIMNDSRLWPYFKDCVGAIDGTHIDACVPKNEQMPYRNRKGVCSQNIMAVCSFDMLFTFVEAGWEGSAHDSRIFQHCIRDPNKNFPHPPRGK